MKYLLTVCITVFSGFFTPSSAQKGKEVPLTLNYEVLHTLEGFSYDAKLVVYVDGKPAGESVAHNQTIPGAVTVKLSRGKHTVRAVLLAKYKDVWEERTVANDYGHDFVWTEEGMFKKRRSVLLIFDIDSGLRTENGH